MHSLCNGLQQLQKKTRCSAHYYDSIFRVSFSRKLYDKAPATVVRALGVQDGEIGVIDF